MRTSEEIYHRIRWDPRFDPARFVLGVNVRGTAPKRVPLPAFTPGGDIPWHRVLFIEADGEVVWDRVAGLDRIDSARAGRSRVARLLRAPIFTAGTPVRWSAAPTEGWHPAPARSGIPAHPGGPARLRVLTWNTLWDRYDSDRIDTVRRRPLLLAALDRADVDVIALQEVEADLLHLLLGTPWVRAGYTVDTDPTGRDVDDTGLLLLSRLPVREAGRHPLGPHKGVAAITVETAAGPVVVVATHLTSDHTEGGAARRQVELARLAEALAGIDGPVVLLGDFNDGGTGPGVLPEVRDAWADVHGAGDRTPTFDPLVNPLAAVSSLSGRPARLDRVLLRGTGLRADAAVLLGDAPATPDGLFVSDHYGVAVDVVLADPSGQHEPPGADGQPHAGTGRPGVDALPTARTAVAWLPPAACRPAIEEIRRRYDPQVDRWPPHVNLLYGFVPESAFAQAAALLAEVAAATAPFPVRLAGVRDFAHRDHHTVWLDPAAAGPQPWTGLWSALVRAFPQCRGHLDGYVPHLTLGRVPDPGPLVADLVARLGDTSTQVGDLVLLSRRGTEPMRPRAAITLGTGELRWLDAEPAGSLDAEPADPDPTGWPATGPGPSRSGSGADDPGVPGEERPDPLTSQVLSRLRDGLPEAVVHVVGSRRLGCALPGADLDLVLALPGELDLSAVQARVRAGLPAATGLRQVVGARVPGLRMRVGDRDVDLVVAASGNVPVAAAVARRAELGTASAVALSAVGDAEALLAAVHPHRSAFVGLARQVKAWARVRGLDSAPFGGLPGLAWTVLAARTVRQAGDLPPAELLRQFFADWAAWDWRTPIALHPTDGPADGHADGPAGVDGLSTGPDTDSPVRILTPSAPVRFCSGQVSVAGRDLLTRELYAAWELLDATPAAPDPAAALLTPPPLHRRHASWAVVTVRAVRGEAFTATLGRVRGRIVALLAALERAGTAEPHAWPRPFETAPDLTRYAIGLGPAAPDPIRFAEAVAGWTAGLPGAGVDRLAGGEVPTLR
ncbi:poly(A) polymerase [Plantactinospora endophytica]|uniref:Polynucleotide adenylyltransferase n=1 Tax=Plantactinospora endophytica TaxID=673535 RepID=A0ABQ4DYU3_9ACTN|nr:poly(A) polymerase [Plantactinospora endophytica]GIG87613.1 hypothetical protein Pen02_25490 [Plantactinospora endophytica]